jgi:hypothetical protein
MNRGNQILIGVLILQVALAVILFWPRQPASAVGEPLFAGLDAEQVVRLTIDDEAGERVQFIKSGEGWVLANSDDYPTTAGTVPELLDKLVALRVGRPVAESKDSHARLKVADAEFASRVELLLQDGTLRTFYVGTSPSYGASHVRVAQQDEVYLVSDLSSADVGTRLSSWIDLSYLSLPAQEVVAVTLENEHGTIEFVKEGEEWTMSGLGEEETASSSVIASLISRTASARMLRPLGTEPKPSYGMQAPNAVLVMHARSAEGTETTYTLHVGAQSEQDNSYVLKSSESPYYVRVAEYTVQDWVENTREDFVEKPEAE